MRFRMAWRNLIRGWRRSLVALAAISFGLGAAVFVVALLAALIPAVRASRGQPVDVMRSVRV